ncbi:MAG TPA: peptide deformylase [Gemmataceae bacterium]|nr:peptide deformylase [Gemmataceae bacterium]
MPAKPILQLGNPLLWERSRPVADPRAPAVQSLIQDLSDTLAEFRKRRGFGRGIAAPQIGVLERVIFVRIPGGFCGPLINPEVVWTSDRQIELWDDCFSFPDLMVRVRRAETVRVRYLDAEALSYQLEADGGLSELLQHEIDHLDGILATDRAIHSRTFATRAEWERAGWPKIDGAGLSSS